MDAHAAELIPAQERRCRLVGNRVDCWRIGPVEVDRCRECVYLLRVEVAGTPASGEVVCAGPSPEAETVFTW
jgi:hypothetical protein